MANYLLLRNNKESGPYTLDDLIELGLKPYDLIWVQGKSAAWRYPSEVTELKPIAPAVEEQPFDRFQKKTEEKKDPPVVAEERPLQVVPAINPEHEKYIPGKSVYVSMPGQKNTPAKEPIKQILPSAPVQPTISISENPAAAQIKYSQPLDEIKEMYVKTLNTRKQKLARKSFWLQNVRRTAALMGLVAIGLIAGYFLRAGKGSQKDPGLQASASELHPLATQGAVILPETDTSNTVNANVPPPVPDSSNSPAEVQTLHQPTGGFVNKPQQPDKPGSVFDKTDDKTAGLKKGLMFTPADNKTGSNLNLAEPQGIDFNATTGERSRKVRTGTENNNVNLPDRTTEKRSSIVPDELAGLVSVRSNEYKKVAFGGIRDLQLTVTNSSKYVLENVLVELQYIKPNELPLKTENIQFTSIGPNSTSTMRVPDTNRGIKVVFRIINIKRRPGDERVAEN